jgi:hypothetical protein
MNGSVLFGGYTIDHEGNRAQLSLSVDPSRKDVEQTLRTITKLWTGVLAAKCKSPPDVGPFELTVYVEGGNFSPMLSSSEEGGDVGVRTLDCAHAKAHTTVEILGEVFPSKHVTTDIDLIRVILCQFIERGNVEADLMK